MDAAIFIAGVKSNSHFVVYLRRIKVVIFDYSESHEKGIRFKT